MNKTYAFIGISFIVLVGSAIVAFVKAAASAAGERIWKKKTSEKAQFRAVSIREKRIIHPNGEQEIYRTIEKRFAEIPNDYDATPVIDTVKRLN